jgi:hypothetical protein
MLRSSEDFIRVKIQNILVRYFNLLMIFKHIKLMILKLNIT